jgi:transposase-like protein
MGLYDYRFYLADESECRKLLHEIRWPRGIRCPRCGIQAIWKLGKNDGFKYKCRSCKYKFTETSGTIFEKTRTPISKWICAIGLFKIGISANQLKDEIQVTYKAAWQILTKIRKAIKRDPLTDQLSGHIEVDETYFGGRQKGKRGRGAAGKTPVIGLIQRNGSVRTIAIPNVKSATLKALIKEHVNSSIMIKFLCLAKGTIPTRLKATGDYQSTSFTHGITKSLRSSCPITWQRLSLNSTNELIRIL